MTPYAYIKVSTGEYPRFQGDIRLEHPEIGEEFFCPNTYIEVYASEMPAQIPGKIISETHPVQVDGRWVQNFSITDAPPPPLKPDLIIQYGAGTSFPLSRPAGSSQIFPTEATGRIQVNILNKESI